MRVLVTGGFGFIGRYVVNRLHADGHEVTVLDHRGGPIPVVSNVVLGDIRDFTSISEAVALSDGVIHLAGVLGTAETVNEPQPAVETNIVGGLNVFKAVRHYDVKAVYIAVGNHWMNNSYSITKTTAERFAFMHNEEHGARIAVVRALNAYGAGQKAEPVRKIIPNFILPCLRGESIRIFGDGEQVMDMIHVSDVADILVRALVQDHGVYDRPFEAGTGRPTTVNQIAEAVIGAVGRGTVEHVPMRAGEPESSVVLGNPETLRPLGDFAPISLEAGLPSTVRYYEAKMAQKIAA
jgi:UDP-glucose 4-epimerase